MVLYICNKCNKNFSRKQSYEIHINRKIPCIPENNINKIIILEEKIKKLENENKNNFEEKIKLLEEKNQFLHTQNYDKDIFEKKIKLLEENIKKLENENNFEEKIKLLEEKNLILHTQNCDKDKCLEKKDLEIKNLYKNIYSKNSDIQIKKIQEYVYIIRECDFVRLNENIYKIGRTAKANPEDRFQKYRKGTEIVGFFGVKDSIECENKMIKCFSNHTNIKKMSEYGKEYFQGNKNELLNEILQIVTNYNI
jgi:hypothetical protein